MDTALIVFIIGTVASFLPIYWLALRLLGRQRKRVRPRRMQPIASGAPAGRREFLDLLRQEAAQRAVAVLTDALGEAQYAAGRSRSERQVLTGATRQSLQEIGRLVDSLFSRELRKSFRDGVDALMSATSSSVEAALPVAAGAVAAFERALAADKPSAAVTPSKLSPWAALRVRWAGWSGNGSDNGGVAA